MARINRYTQIIETIFANHYQPGDEKVEFGRDEIEPIAKSLEIALPKNGNN